MYISCTELWSHSGAKAAWSGDSTQQAADTAQTVEEEACAAGLAHRDTDCAGPHHHMPGQWAGPLGVTAVKHHVICHA